MEVRRNDMKTYLTWEVWYALSIVAAFYLLGVIV
jgi:hypothetical protein